MLNLAHLGVLLFDSHYHCLVPLNAVDIDHQVPLNLEDLDGFYKQPIRTRYLGHVTGYQPIRDQYFLIRSVPVLAEATMLQC